jgi:outer membrane protein OmpA-like peptidoglycan-associated protein
MKKMKMNEAIFFKLRESDANAASGIDEAIKKVADLMKTSDDAQFTVTGYADKGTGSAKKNKKYAQKRADDVAKKLVEQYGLDAGRLKTDSKGDAVQPFEENDKNRCVIITGEGTFKVTVYEDAEVEKKETRKVKKVRVRQEEVKERVD